MIYKRSFTKEVPHFTPATMYRLAGGGWGGTVSNHFRDVKYEGWFLFNCILLYAREV